MQNIFTITPCTLPTYNGVCFRLTGSKTYFVTAQPQATTTNPYQAIANAGIVSVVSVRDANETAAPPFDPNEADRLLSIGVAYTNIPLPHIALLQQVFDVQAYHVGKFLNDSIGPTLIHCSSGDRASAGFGAFLVNIGMSNTDAVTFAKSLALQNTTFIGWLSAYKPRQT